MNPKCHKQFSVKTQSIFENSPVPLDKWLTAVWLVVNCKNGVSSYELMRHLGVTQKTAWFMLNRIRLALMDCNWSRPASGQDLGSVEVHEICVPAHTQDAHNAQ